MNFKSRLKIVGPEVLHPSTSYALMMARGTTINESRLSPWSIDGRNHSSLLDLDAMPQICLVKTE